jgi:predicted esterase
MLAIDATRVVIGGFSDGASYATEILFASMDGVRAIEMGLV